MDYLQTTEEHFQKGAQNPTQTAHESSCQATIKKQQAPQISESDNAGQLLNLFLVGDTRFELVTSAV
ncbi:MAG: hypothetical protein GXP28_00510 [Planctomycetes bacterium]|nr:hypothetical protein [Planctomycetota bacterium]